MNLFQLALLLWKLGYMPDVKTIADVLKLLSNGVEKFLAAFQSQHGLKPTGNLDEATKALLKRHRCGQPDIMESRADTCKWPSNRVTWSQAIRLPTLAPDVVDRIYATAWNQWASVCGLTPVLAGPSDAPHVRATAGAGPLNHLDGAGGVLAWSELPCGATDATRLQQMFDQSELWNEPMFLAVACHEIGHAIGLPHLPTGSLMAPYYDAKITAPTPVDIAEAVARYGPPVAPSDPLPKPLPNPPVPPASTTFRLDVAEPGAYLVTWSVAKL